MDSWGSKRARVSNRQLWTFVLEEFWDTISVMFDGELVLPFDYNSMVAYNTKFATYVQKSKRAHDLLTTLEEQKKE